MVERFSPLNYWLGKQVKSVTPEDQLLIFFIRIRLDLPYYDFARRYSVNPTTIQNIIMTYLHALHDISFVVSRKTFLPLIKTSAVCQILLLAQPIAELSLIVWNLGLQLQGKTF